MTLTMEPIGVVHTDANEIPRHWTLSDVKGTLVVDEKYRTGLKDIKAGQHLVVIFLFHKSPDFTPGLLIQTPPHRNRPMGVFSICSPNRPNPIGMSVLEVLEVSGNIIHVQGLDMFNGTPILDLKPYITDRHSCPSYRENRENTLD